MSAALKNFDTKKIAKAAKIIFLAVLLLSLLAWFIFSSALRNFLLLHPGLLGVLIGVSGEVFFDWKEEKGKHARWKKFFMALLVVSLAYELFEASESDKKAANAIELAGQANVRAANTESNNLVLKQNLLQLEEKVQWRTISPTQETNLILAIKPFNKDVLPASKKVVVLLYNSSDIEAWYFADRIVEVLKKCDFDVEIKSPNVLPQVGIEPFPSGLIFIWSKNETIPVNFSEVQKNFFLQGWVPIPYAVTVPPIPEGVFEILVSYKPKK